MKKHLNTRGFTAIEGLLIILILAVIGFSGYYVWHTQHANNASSTATNGATTTVSTFAECEKSAGSITQQTFPEKCVTKNGELFTNTSTKLVAKAITATYQTVPSDLRKAVMAYAQINFPACITSTGTGFVSFSNAGVDPQIVYADSRAAAVSSVCGDTGPQQLYVFSNSAWTFASASVDGFSCTTLQKYNIPAVILGSNPQCWVNIGTKQTQIAYTESM